MLDEKDIVNVTESFERLAKEFTKIFSSLANRLKEICSELEVGRGEHLSYERELKLRRKLYKLNFKRPKIQHQVLDRKPRNLIRKMI